MLGKHSFNIEIFHLSYLPNSQSKESSPPSLPPSSLQRPSFPQTFILTYFPLNENVRKIGEMHPGWYPRAHTLQGKGKSEGIRPRLEAHPKAETNVGKEGEARPAAEGTRRDGGTAEVSCALHSPRITAPMNKLVTTRSSQNSL